MTLKIKITTLNNKSRKGTYIYIKQPNKAGRHYKYDEITPTDAYIQYYKDTKKQGTLNQYKKAFRQEKTKQHITNITQKYIQKLTKNKPKINTAIKKGITTTTIKNLQNTPNSTLHKRTTNLFKGRVIDKKIAELLSTDENIKKLKQRLEYRIQIKDNKNTLITTTIFNKTPKEVKNLLKQAIQHNNTIEQNDYNIKTKLKNLGFQEPQQTNHGKITHTTTTIILRKQN